MSDFRAFLVAICINATLFIVFTASYFVYVHYKKSFVPLPNGYYLKVHSGSDVSLSDPKGKILQKQTCEFNVTDMLVYGYSDLDGHNFYLLDTKSGHYYRFSNWETMERASKTLTRENLNGHLLTYLDYRYSKE